MAAETMFIALKRFGGGRKLRAKFGTGVGRLVQQGTLIPKSAFSGESHLKSILALELVEEYDEKKKDQYRTQADREVKARKRKAEENKKKKSEKKG